MYTVQHLPHTADVRIKLVADTREELFLAGILTIAEMLCSKPKFHADSNESIASHSKWVL